MQTPLYGLREASTGFQRAPGTFPPPRPACAFPPIPPEEKHSRLALHRETKAQLMVRSGRKQE